MASVPLLSRGTSILEKNMKINIFIPLVIVFSLSMQTQAEIDSQFLTHGWMAWTKQSDPFDKSIVDVFSISKDGFSFSCRTLNMSVGSKAHRYKSYSFGAEIKYIIDENTPKDKSGKFSTGLNGSDRLSRSRYYSFKMKKNDINAMKAGNVMKVAGHIGSGDWTNRTINLKGFTSAYDLMCDQ